MPPCAAQAASAGRRDSWSLMTASRRVEIANGTNQMRSTVSNRPRTQRCTTDAGRGYAREDEHAGEQRTNLQPRGELRCEQAADAVRRGGARVDLGPGAGLPATAKRTPSRGALQTVADPPLWVPLAPGLGKRPLRSRLARLRAQVELRHDGTRASGHACPSKRDMLVYPSHTGGCRPAGVMGRSGGVIAAIWSGRTLAPR